ncbi:hypothetical protein OIO90_006568 [Microbotryomycetes sp. JL221]|nr:hypothetical protein OIO90_006568 [Microbotryomycetes sp. JL221]
MPRSGLRVPVLRWLAPRRQTSLRRANGHDIFEPSNNAVGLILRSAVSILVCSVPIVLLVLFVIKHKRSTLVLDEAQIERIWAWELASGHFPSSRQPDIRPAQVGSAPGSSKFNNPGLPNSMVAKGQVPSGPERVYLDPSETPKSARNGFAWPSRPAFGTALDLDVVMEQCDFSKGKYVRDCLELLRVNAGLQHSSTRRGALDPWMAHFQTTGQSMAPRRSFNSDSPSVLLDSSASVFRTALYARSQHTQSHVASNSMMDAISHSTHPSADPVCDPDNPRLFHIFWTGDVTDKPYMAALSFLYTQNLGLDRSRSSPASSHRCRPQLWIWINPGPASSLPNAQALEEFEAAMLSNPWSAPLLHPRFSEHVKFRLWNTTEQLDGVERMEGWRSKPLFQSHGKKYKSPDQSSQGKLFQRAGSADAKSYDRLSVVLSDMARFVLTYRFGGIYLDADTILLRDWEELFNWRGAFAYRWSRLPLYNTAVLKMQRGSMTGDWLFKTAVANGNDFHPMTLSRYTKDAHMDGLILRLPDALFDPPWLNVENYQRDRPAFPSFKSFDDFFNLPSNDLESGTPSAVGFNGFFRGAFSYHWHNFWWRPFDSDLNFPDLGPRFPVVKTATALRVCNFTQLDPIDLNEERLGMGPTPDLSWSQVLKRTFESFIRGETPNMYGEFIDYE